MAAVRVDRVALRLLAPPALRDRRAQLQSRAANAFVPALLEVLAQRLESLYGPDAVLRIPTLRLRLRMPASSLAGADWTERVGADLAAQVQAWVERRPPGTLAEDDAAQAQRFLDAPQLQAARLVAAACAMRGPLGEVEDFAAVWHGIRQHAPPEREAVLLRLGVLERYEAVVARWPVQDLQEVLSVMQERAPAAFVRRLREAIATPREEATSQPSAPKPGWSDPVAQGKDAPLDASAAHDVRGTAVQPTMPADAAPMGRAAATKDASRRTALDPVRPIAEGQPAGESAACALHRPDLPSPSLAAPVVRAPARKAAPPESTQPRPAQRTPAASEAPLDANAADDAVGVASVLSWPSRWCGLACLLNIALRLELPERLWQVGLPEGDVLAAMFARIAGSDDDPVVRMPSPAFPGTHGSLPALPQWAREELVDGTAAAAWRWPAVGAEREGVQARVAELQAWYGSGAGFDVAAWAAAWHVAITESLLQERLGPPWLARRFARQGQVVLAREELRIVQPLESVDLDIRRAALDADPGWLPWLRKRLVFVFEGPPGAEP